MKSQHEIERDYLAREEKLLADLDVASRLKRVFAKPGGLKNFAEKFYHIRAHFVRTNFVVGSRCPVHEKYWAGLARNLMEELGAGKTPPHNELYRRFLGAVAARPEAQIEVPSYAVSFNSEWESFAQNAPILDAIAAIAVYEIFDQPDYQLLLDSISSYIREDDVIQFFSVHAQAGHFELFDTFLSDPEVSGALVKSIERGGTFVMERQRFIWERLLEDLEASTALPS